MASTSLKPASVTLKRPAGQRWLHVLIVAIVVIAATLTWWSLTMPTPDERLEVHYEHDGTTHPIRVDLFLPEDRDRIAERHPAVILLHGVEGADRYARAYFQTARRLNRQGYAVFFVHYFDSVAYDDLWLLDERGGIDTETIARRCYEDADRWTGAVTSVLAEMTLRTDIDPDRIAIEGFSLGGFVTLAAAARAETDVSLPDLQAIVVNWGAKFDTTTIPAEFPPTLFVHGEHDEVVPLSDAERAVAAIIDAGGDAELMVITAGGHTASSLESTERTLEFLKRHLIPASQIESVAVWGGPYDSERLSRRDLEIWLVK